MPDPNQQSFLKAVAAYQTKRYKQAKTLCREILRAFPEHVACLHLLGVSEFNLGNQNEAERLIRKSLSLNSDFPEMHYSFGLVLAGGGKYIEAIVAFRKTIDLKPSHAEAFYEIGKAHRILGEFGAALEAYQSAATLKPLYPELFNSIGILFYEQGRLGEGVEAFEHALKLRPDFPEGLNNLGAAYIDQKRFAAAEKACHRAIALYPEYAAAFCNLGNALRGQQKWDEARRSYEASMELDPNSLEARNNLGLLFLDGYSDPDAAMTCFDQILTSNPGHVTALTHRGIALCHKGQFKEGEACYRKALSLKPDHREAINNLGNALKALGRSEEALEAYYQVLAASPNDPEAHNNLAMSLLALGRFEEGWREYEWRWQTSQLISARREFSQPQWYGEDAKGKIILIHAEQGFGDTLQFCRYVPEVLARGMRVVLEVQSELVRLFRGLPGVLQVIARGDPLPAFDLHCPMLSLPLAFAMRLETIPSVVPYLHADPELFSLWKHRVEQHAGYNPASLRVGLIWAGNPRLFSADLAAANRRRSIAPELLEPLKDIQGVVFYSLQTGGPNAPSSLVLVNLIDDCEDFADTAALIANLDLVISVDTAVAHLAGALGKPVWLLNRYDSCWRWLQDRTDSPWYPTIRLFRQSDPGVWTSVITSICDELERKKEDLSLSRPEFSAQ